MSKLLIAFMLGFMAANIIHAYVTPEDAYRAGVWVRSKLEGKAEKEQG